jgi:hypothetical protein
MNATTRSVTVLAFLLAGALPALGQERPVVPAFSTVRLTSPGYTGVATLVSLGSDSLELGIEGLTQPIVVPIRSVDRLELRRPATRRERATRGALWGAGTLGILGPLLADRDGNTSSAEVALHSVLAGGLWGGAIGLLVPQSRWEGVQLPERQDRNSCRPSSDAGKSGSVTARKASGAMPLPDYPQRASATCRL